MGERRSSVRNSLEFFIYSALGLVAGVAFFGFQIDSHGIAVKYIRMAVAVGGGLGMLAKLISESEYTAMKVISAFFMNLACAFAGISVAMIIYI
ncbi:hypothetical protein [Pseudomonas gingeri]|uniref:Uncharacterized protein n=1 Tax=Pseudomonas gingeri TaxID=117681 RepID=A0A7Y7YFS6_9PSED|nr:hypothetical protein [Pseudomonas gingeri]NWB27887.1 hypothetical protein [Pseudomonas gingeri]NWC35410.1 hypothetical protein [Pseudomonas gingeri]NWD04512.1 hypothetical protein [Pseudomonas gingeri]NWE31121.1 hypothetical protein [Pseudomonas gingeri]NWE59183.1 hypothetical protein [Pseudomonas gingeri]